MLQIDHIYEFFYQEIFKNFDIYHLPGGVTKEGPITWYDYVILRTGPFDNRFKILFYDQEPLVLELSKKYIDFFRFPIGIGLEEVRQHLIKNAGSDLDIPDDKTHLLNLADPNRVYKEPNIIITSEKSQQVNLYLEKYNMKGIYYFFHGFAALDWFRGYYALNYTKDVIKDYKYDFISFNRIVTGDRAYRADFVKQLRENDLLDFGAVSYGVTDDPVTDDRMIIDHEQLPGSASADIPKIVNDALWHIVTETVFYYDKLHLTEKIFKPIVSKQPFMLLAAPGNLEYLRSYGFKTFDGIIDESYDTIEDNDARIDAVVAQMKWYCNLSQEEKSRVIESLAPIVEYNFQHFYGKFKEIITDELLDNTKTLFKEIEYNDSDVNYATVRKLLTS